MKLVNFKCHSANKSGAGRSSIIPFSFNSQLSHLPLLLTYNLYYTIAY